jgi:anti-sigma-K factor RskA
MDAEKLHDLTAAYALDALDGGERDAYEAHLAECEGCRRELAEFSSVAASLGRAVEPAPPPPALRERILEAARAERPNVVPLRPRWAYPAAAAAAVAACAAVGLGIWGVTLHNRLGNSSVQAIRRVPVSGAPGSFVVYAGQSAGLVLANLAAAPAGKTYEAWVVEGRAAAPAGLFRAGSGTTYLPLTRKVPRGAVVAVTVEPAGGSARPTAKPFLVSLPV